MLPQGLLSAQLPLHLWDLVEYAVTYVPFWQDVLRKAGQLGALGSLEDNCPDDDEEVAEGGEDGEEDEDADEEDVKDDGAADDLASAMAQKVHIS